MREILFRAKRITDGVWVYGGYIVTGVGGHYIVEPDTRLPTSIDPNTVGQYTGVKDRDGHKIFEGDIVTGHFGNYCGKIVGVVTYGTGAAYYLEGGRCPFGVSLSNADFWMTVIGNRWDNPELLEVPE